MSMLGIFLLLAARNPSANRRVIAFAAWSSFAHAAIRTQALLNLIARAELVGVAALVIIGVSLIALAPASSHQEAMNAAAIIIIVIAATGVAHDAVPQAMAGEGQYRCHNSDHWAVRGLASPAWASLRI